MASKLRIVKKDTVSDEKVQKSVVLLRALQLKVEGYDYVQMAEAIKDEKNVTIEPLVLRKWIAAALELNEEATKKMANIVRSEIEIQYRVAIKALMENVKDGDTRAINALVKINKERADNWGIKLSPIAEARQLAPITIVFGIDPYEAGYPKVTEPGKLKSANPNRE